MCNVKLNALKFELGKKIHLKDVWFWKEFKRQCPYVSPGELNRQMLCPSFLCVGMSLGQEENNPKMLSQGDPEQSSVREGSHCVQQMCPNGCDCRAGGKLLWSGWLPWKTCSNLHKLLVLIKHLNEWHKMHPTATPGWIYCNLSKKPNKPSGPRFADMNRETQK